MSAKLLVVFSFQESNSKEKEFECERISTRRVIGIPGMRYLMCYCTCAGGAATTDTFFVTKRQVTPGALPEAVNVGGVFHKIRKQVQYSISLGFHRIALELGVSLCLCEISADFGEFHKETKTQDSGDQFISRYSPDIRVLSIYLQVYTCIFTRLCPKAGRVLNSARFFPLLACLSIGTLETLIGSRAVPICEVRLFQYEIMVLACQVGPVHLTLAQINWEMNCIAKNKCTFRKTWSVQRRMNAPTESINEKLVAYEVTSSLVIALKSVSHLFVDRQTICNTKRAVLAVLIRFCGTILSETKSCKD